MTTNPKTELARQIRELNDQTAAVIAKVEKLIAKQKLARARKEGESAN